MQEKLPKKSKETGTGTVVAAKHPTVPFMQETFHFAAVRLFFFFVFLVAGFH